MSQFHNSPAVLKILRALGTGESLSNREIRDRTRNPDSSDDRDRAGSELKKDQREKLIAEGLLVVKAVKRSLTHTLTDAGMAFVRDELGGPTTAPSASPRRLNDRERMALFATLSASLQVSHSDIKSTIGVAIGKPVRSSLRDQGLITVLDKPIRFEVTEKGWQAAEAELSRPGEADDPPLLKLLHAILAQLLAGLRSRGLSLADMYAETYGDRTARARSAPAPVKTVGARVIDAYDELVYEPGGWVSLTRLRDHLADVDRSECDEVLSALFRDGRIKLIAEVNQKTLTERDRAAALRIVGDEKHLYAVG